MPHYPIDHFNNISAEIKFNCPKCGHVNTTDELSYPSPDYSSETIHDSYSSESETEYCTQCGEEFEFEIWASIADGYIDIPFDDKYIIAVDETPSLAFKQYVDEQIELALADKTHYDIFKEAINNCDQIFELGKSAHHIEKVLYNQAYSGLVTAMEAYLSSTFIYQIMSNDDYFMKFVEHYEKFKIEKFTLSEFYSIEKKLKNKVKYELTEIIYHNLYKLKTNFEKVFDITFPNIDSLSEIIKNRHDIVHRNGKNKDGDEIVVTEDNYNNAKSKIMDFVSELNNNFT